MKNTHNNSIARTDVGTFGGWLRLAFCLLALVAATAASAGSTFSSIVVFGDSLSDTGRLYQLTNGGFPPRIAYFHGRQSNGHVWVEYLAESLKLENRLKNYAVVGALTGPSVSVPTGNVWSDTYPGLEGTSLSGQLSRYLAERGGSIDPDALYIIEGGGNDLIGPLSGGGGDINAIIYQLVTNVATIAGTLKQMGAQHIAVVNVPDFGKTPRLAAYGPVLAGQVSWLVGVVNSYVAGALNGIDSLGGNKIARIDAFGFIGGVVAAPASFGFTNVTGAFMTLDMGTNTVTYAAPKHNAVKQWFFWDDLHPTTRGHRSFAKNAYTTLKVAFPDSFTGCKDDE